MRYKIVYFGGDGIAVNLGPTKLFRITLHHGKSRYYSLRNMHKIQISRKGIQNRLIVNNTAIFTWCTIGKNSYSYKKMNKLIRIVKRKLKINQMNA